MLQLAQIQLHMLNQNAAAIPDALAACTQMLVQLSQEPQQQAITSQLQLHFCVLRVLALLGEGRHVELQKTGEASSAFLGLSLSNGVANQWTSVHALCVHCQDVCTQPDWHASSANVAY